jgi:c-di-GMP-binding flagellar brake protein YcgR
MPFMGRSVNISASGMLLEAAALMGEGDRLSCVFMLPGEAQVTAHAEVVRVVSAEREDRPFRYGLRFLSISKESESALEGFVEGQAMRA